MYGEENNLDVSIKASDFEKIPVSFEKVGIEFSNLEGEFDRPMGTVRIRVKTDDANNLMMTKDVEMEVISPGYLLVDVPWFKQIMGKFGDSLRIKWNFGERIILEDKNGIASKIPIISGYKKEEC